MIYILHLKSTQISFHHQVQRSIARLQLSLQQEDNYPNIITQKNIKKKQIKKVTKLVKN